MKKTIILLTCICAAFSTFAQTFQEGFFLDGYQLAYRYNPAMSNDGNFLSLGQWSNQSRNNFGAASFLYPQQSGEILTAFHHDVPADTFLGSLKDDNYFNGAINFNLFAHGWRKGDGYHTIEANIRGLYNASIPKEIFSIFKLGTGSTLYDLGGFQMGGKAYAELAYGYSHRFSDIVSIGARAKLLVGVESFNYRVSVFDMSLSEDSYTADIAADLDMSSRMGKIGVDDGGYLNLLDISAKDKWRLPSGAGLSFDLGIVVTPVEGLTLSASVLDLGALVWFYGNAASSSGKVTFEGVKDLSMEDITSGDIMKHFNDVSEDFFDSLRPKAVDNRVSFEAIPFNANVGIKYKMPFYRALALGATANYIVWSGMNYKEVRAAASWNPSGTFGICASIGTGDYGPVYGAALNCPLWRFRLHAGIQNGFGGTVPYTSTPLKPNNKLVTLGLTYQL